MTNIFCVGYTVIRVVYICFCIAYTIFELALTGYENKCFEVMDWEKNTKKTLLEKNRKEKKIMMKIDVIVPKLY